ncbi:MULTISPECIES: MarR family winged helix-turn-helix transcriptional regulator [Flavobacteriaceae]|uniref:MarR family winged helix-turn-helix transcriptional regulator n=1 Tax=Flavobacteriaceae TaxID=49546 RepID=UPI0014926DD5|nr:MULTISPECIES: MarR family transcriptional regulator [Allomuricauda]MDC6367543.1 MarR family transcriptional regulator [Muricauda sp. AC10]
MNGLPTRTVFYTIERAIKEYRRFAQKKIHKLDNEITVDHALILFFIADKPDLSQSDIGELIFKDNASVTRMIELMIKNGFLKRAIHEQDRRKFKITLTQKGLKVKDDLQKIVQQNRAYALEGISRAELDQMNHTLNKIIKNCTT